MNTDQPINVSITVYAAPDQDAGVIDRIVGLCLTMDEVSTKQSGRLWLSFQSTREASVICQSLEDDGFEIGVDFELRITR